MKVWRGRDGVNTAYVWLLLAALGAGGLVAGGMVLQTGLSARYLSRLFAGVLVGMAVGARLGVVLGAGGEWRAFLRPDWMMGSAHGALIGALVAWWFAAPGRERWKIADALASGTSVALAVGWLGMLLHPVVYGSLWRGGMLLPDAAGIESARFPLALVASAWYAIVALLLVGIWRVQRHSGFAAWVWLVAFGAQHALLGFVRGDAGVWIGMWRVEQVIGVVEAGAGLLMLAVWRWRLQRH